MGSVSGIVCCTIVVLTTVVSLIPQSRQIQGRYKSRLGVIGWESVPPLVLDMHCIAYGALNLSSY